MPSLPFSEALLAGYVRQGKGKVAKLLLKGGSVIIDEGGATYSIAIMGMPRTLTRTQGKGRRYLRQAMKQADSLARLYGGWAPGQEGLN